MIRLTDEQWERIRDHFPEESIAWAQTDSDALCARSGTVDSQHGRAVALRARW